MGSSPIARFDERPALAGFRDSEPTATGGAAGPTEYAYQWSRCDAAGAACAPIAGAVSPNYAVGPQNVGSRLMVTVTARNALTSAPADSLVTAVVA